MERPRLERQGSRLGCYLCLSAITALAAIGCFVTGLITIIICSIGAYGNHQVCPAGTTPIGRRALKGSTYHPPSPSCVDANGYGVFAISVPPTQADYDHWFPGVVAGAILLGISLVAALFFCCFESKAEREQMGMSYSSRARKRCCSCCTPREPQEEKNPPYVSGGYVLPPRIPTAPYPYPAPQQQFGAQNIMMDIALVEMVVAGAEVAEDLAMY